MRYEFIDAEKAIWPVRITCRVLEVFAFRLPTLGVAVNPRSELSKMPGSRRRSEVFTRQAVKPTGVLEFTWT